jgi:glycerol-3-phosphate dehydrogenase (NAD(P)+)
MSTVSIIGATTWGNTIGRLLANKNIMVNIWTRTEARARELSKSLQQYPASTSSNINFTNHSNNALRGAEYVIWAVPAQSLRQTIRQVADQITVSMLHVSLAKGLEAENSKRMSEVIAEEISATTPEQICVLSGPNLSQEN